MQSYTKIDRVSKNPYLLMSLLLILWGSFAAVARLVLNNIDSFQTQFYMFGIAAIVMTVTLIVKGKYKELYVIPKSALIRAAFYALPYFFYYFLYTLSLKIIPTTEAAMLNYLFPIMIVIFAIPINGEKLNFIKVTSIIVSFVGMLVIITDGKLSGLGLTNIYGDILAIGGAVSWGVFSCLGKRNLENIFISNYICILVSFVLSTISMFVFSSFTIPAMASWIGLLWLSASNIIFAVFLWIKSLQIAPVALIASLSFITPFVSLLFIMIILGESIHLVQGIGLIIILSGTAFQNIRRKSCKYYDSIIK